MIDGDARLALEALRLDLPLAGSLIYATASPHGATLWTHDADFADLDGVRYFKK